MEFKDIHVLEDRGGDISDTLPNLDSSPTRASVCTNTDVTVLGRSE